MNIFSIDYYGIFRRVIMEFLRHGIDGNNKNIIICYNFSIYYYYIFRRIAFRIFGYHGIYC